MLSNHRGLPRSVFKSGLAGLIAVFLFTSSPPGHGAAVVTVPGGIGAEYVAPAPDLALSSNGSYDAQTLRNTPSFADPFKLRFVRLDTGGTTPGAQPCTVYNADFTTQRQGQTTSVPEPTIALLLFSGIVVAGSRWMASLRCAMPTPRATGRPLKKMGLRHYVGMARRSDAIHRGGGE